MADRTSTDSPVPERRILLLSGLFAAIAFWVDLLLPAGVVIGIAYVAIVLFSLWTPKPAFTIVAAIASTLLIVAGFFFSARGHQIIWHAVTNRTLHWRHLGHRPGRSATQAFRRDVPRGKERHRPARTGYVGPGGKCPSRTMESALTRNTRSESLMFFRGCMAAMSTRGQASVWLSAAGLRNAIRLLSRLSLVRAKAPDSWL